MNAGGPRPLRQTPAPRRDDVVDPHPAVRPDATDYLGGLLGVVRTITALADYQRQQIGDGNLTAGGKQFFASRGASRNEVLVFLIQRCVWHRGSLFLVHRENLVKQMWNVACVCHWETRLA